VLPRVLKTLQAYSIKNVTTDITADIAGNKRVLQAIFFVSLQLFYSELTIEIPIAILFCESYAMKLRDFYFVLTITPIRVMTFVSKCNKNSIYDETVVDKKKSILI